jgi:hypothetical protein
MPSYVTANLKRAKGYDLTFVPRIITAIYPMDYSYKCAKAIYDADVPILPPSDSNISKEHII